jgi:hypothetical protein
MARSKLDEHKLREVELEDITPGERVDAGPFELEIVHMTHSIPDASAVVLRTELGAVVVPGIVEAPYGQLRVGHPIEVQLRPEPETGLTLLRFIPQPP